MKKGTTETPRERQCAYRFGSFKLTADGALLRGQTSIHLPPKELAALRFLLANAGRLVTPAQLKQALWGDLHVTDESVPRCLSSLRARLQPDDCIQTEYKRGYRIAVAVQRFDTASAQPVPRVAILPFATGYQVPDHMGHAVAEETIARLSRDGSSRMTVLARDSAFTLARGGQTAQKVGEALKADLVLTGSLRAMPTHLRLRVEMIRVQDGTQVWVEDVLVPQARMAAAETELAQRLVTRLGSGPAIFASAEVPEDGKQPSRRHEAYDLFLRGHHEWQTLQRHRMQDGLQHLFRATETDPSFVPAQVDLVNVSITEAFYGFMSPAVAADLVRRIARSVPADFDGAEAILPALGWIRLHVDHDLPGALEAFAGCAHLPHDPWTTRARVMFALSRHRFAEAVTLLEGALGVDPYSPWLHARLGWALHLAGEKKASTAQAERAIDLFPEHEGAALYGSMILAYNGHGRRGVQLASDLAKRSAYFDPATAAHAYALACNGERDEARDTLERMQWLSRERFVLSSFTPAVCVVLDETETAIAELGNSERTRCPWFFQMLADPRLTELHGHPEFERMRGLLARMEAEAAGTSPK